MFALFLTLTLVVALLLWSDLPEARLAQVAAPARGRAPAAIAPAIAPVAPLPLPPRRAQQDAQDDALLRRVAEAAQDEPGDLPRISDFAPGDVIELEIVGAVPPSAQIRFEQRGPDARVLLSGQPALVIENAQADALTPDCLRFRAV